MMRLERRLREIIVCLCVIYSVNGLSCLECTLSSLNGTLCTDSLDITHLNRTQITSLDCQRSIFTQGNFNNEEFICISVIQQNDSIPVYTRRCGLKSESNICDKMKEESGDLKLTHCNVCQTDFCNSSVISKSSVTLCLLGVILLLFNK